MIRELISAKLGVEIPEGQWDRVFKSLDTQGKITQRVLYELIVELLKTVEKLERNIEILNMPKTEKPVEIKKDEQPINSTLFAPKV
jgi:hypothetical protein